MIVSGVTPAQFIEAVEKAGAHYDGNLRAEIGREFTRKDGSCQRFTARVVLRHTGFQLYGKGDDLAPGQRRSWQGRRINAACWHAYRDALQELFNTEPDAKVSTAFAKYHGAEQFSEKFPATGWANIGSMVQPVQYREACDCWN